MLNAKEMLQVQKLRETRDNEVKGARRWYHDDGKYTARKVALKFARSCIKNARKASAKLARTLATGRARPISIVLQTILPLRDVAVARAIKEARKDVADCRARVGKLGFDVAYPHADAPKFSNYHDRYTTKGKALLHAVAVQNGRRAWAKDVQDDEGADRFATNQARDAEYQFMAYAGKLETKVGEVTAASLEQVEGLWGESYLTVHTATSERVLWKTQMIWNRSVLGKVFMQFPTRIVKGRA